MNVEIFVEIYWKSRFIESSANVHRIDVSDDDVTYRDLQNILKCNYERELQQNTKEIFFKVFVCYFPFC